MTDGRRTAPGSCKRWLEFSAASVAGLVLRMFPICTQLSLLASRVLSTIHYEPIELAPLGYGGQARPAARQPLEGLLHQSLLVEFYLTADLVLWVQSGGSVQVVF